MNLLPTETGIDSFTNKVKNETKIFTNINYILDKLEGDGYFLSVKDTFCLILEKEMTFAIGGTFKKN